MAVYIALYTKRAEVLLRSIIMIIKVQHFIELKKVITRTCMEEREYNVFIELVLHTSY